MTLRLRRSRPFLGLCLLASTLMTIGCHRSISSEEKHEAGESKPDAGHEPDAGVHLDPEKQKRMGLDVKPLTASAYKSQVELYGTLESDPAEVFVLRAPIAGTVETEHGEWPTLGSRLPGHSRVGSISPQLATSDQLTLTDRLSTVQAEEAAGTASVATATAEYERLKALNADNKNVSDKVLQEAEARLKGEQAQLEAARQSQKLLVSALHGTGNNSFVTPLIAARDGQVSEVLAQPGERVEAGQPILRINRFDTLIARLNLPLSQRIELPIKSAFISAVGEENNTISARFIARAPMIESEYQSQTLLFRVSSPSGALRPGQAIEGWIPTRSVSNQPGVSIPFRAIVRYQGHDWVYLQVKDTEFSRKPIDLSEPEKDGWFVSHGLRAGDRVVVSGAQTLLSEEMKSELSADQD